DLFLIEHGDLHQDHGAVGRLRVLQQLVVFSAIVVLLPPVAAAAAAANQPQGGDDERHVESLEEEHDRHGDADVDGQLQRRQHHPAPHCPPCPCQPAAHHPDRPA
ncbi:Os09g0572525, partial [Oryza sativa Japonica Group]